MKRAAKAACGLEDTRSKTSQWMVGHEDRAREFNLKGSQKTERGNKRGARHNAREELKTARKEFRVGNRMVGSSLSQMRGSYA